MNLKETIRAVEEVEDIALTDDNFTQEHLTARKASIPMTSSWQMKTHQMQHSGMRPLRILRRSAAG